MTPFRFSALTALSLAAVAVSGPAFAIPKDQISLSPAQWEVVDPLGAALRARLDTSKRKLDESEKGDYEAVLAFYRENQFSPRWTDGVTLNEQAKKLLTVFAAAPKDGLDPKDYALPDAATLGIDVGTPDALAEAEVTLSLSLVRFTRHLQSGRIRPIQVSGHITLEPEIPDGHAVLQKFLITKTPDVLVASHAPQHEEYLMLRRKLAEIRGGVESSRPAPIPPGRALKLGVVGERVVLLRKAIGAPVPELDAEVFDEELREAVREWQRSVGLRGDGIVGPRTIRKINGDTPKDQTQTILTNMEQWRWMPRELGRFHVRVNIPEYRLRLMRGSTVAHTTRVVVGKVANMTPVFSDEMEHVIVNPYWNIPLSIKANELLSGIMANPSGYMARKNYEVLMGGKRVNPNSINWSRINLKAVNIRQRPGPGNALGRIKFMFPNKHAVYLHDTPSKSLFQRDTRAFSHGCVRVQNPMKFADALMRNEPNITGSQLENMVGGNETKVDLTKHIPVHLTYFTGWVDKTGKVRTAKDVYGHHRKLASCLRDHARGRACFHPTPKKVIKPRPARDPFYGDDDDGGFFVFSRSRRPRPPVVLFSHDR